MKSMNEITEGLKEMKSLQTLTLDLQYSY